MSNELKPRESIDTPEFVKLLCRLMETYAQDADEEYHHVRSALIAHIDAWGARIAGVPAGWRMVPEVPTNEIICAIERKVDDQLVASGMWAADMFRQDGENIYEAVLAAAPTHDKEDKPVAEGKGDAA